MMRISKKTIFYSILSAIIFFVLLTLKLPYYIYKPGEADELSPMVVVESGYSSEGELHLVTVSGGQATPIQYLLAKMSPFQEITTLEEARPQGFTDEEYMRHQLKMMENSQDSSKVVAYKAANRKVDIDFNGVYVIHTIEDMPAADVIEMGDRIIAVDDLTIKEAADLIDYVLTKQTGETINLHIERNNEKMMKTVEVATFPDDKEKVGIGIQLVTDQKVTVEPEVEIKSGNIGGPSAGLMFALEMYDQLTEEDLTKGYLIAGTGEIDFEGNVSRIGGIDKKVVAAHQKGIDIFFAPYEHGDPESNYEIAKETAELIETDMKIVPIDTFEEALAYLDQLELKNN